MANLGSLVLSALLFNGTYPDRQSHALDGRDKTWGRKIISSFFHRYGAEQGKNLFNSHQIICGMVRG